MKDLVTTELSAVFEKSLDDIKKAVHHARNDIPSVVYTNVEQDTLALLLENLALEKIDTDKATFFGTDADEKGLLKILAPLTCLWYLFWLRLIANTAIGGKISVSTVCQKGQ